ncbi:MAG: CPBP family intramembrane metalloprotease [Verrucomicrobiales bacterium]|nr:CPBP family intramembrane metalloprotease [Verrucomicrobiales bacterium]
MDAPPILATTPPPAARPPVAVWRTGIMLVLVGSYPLIVGLVGRWLDSGHAGGTVLPGTVPGLLAACAENLALFLILFGIGAAIARPTRAELFATGFPGWKDWLLGLGYSVGLRMGLAILLAAGLMVAGAVLQLKGQSLQSLQGLRPEVENLLDPGALRNPVYFLLSLTVVSFVVAGFREELWRAVVFAAVLRLAPRAGTSIPRRLGMVAAAAVIFGLGHLAMGWSGVVLTGLLGLGLGGILIFHRSLWLAVLAHGFFDATSFVLFRVIDAMGALDTLLRK